MRRIGVVVFLLGLAGAAVWFTASLYLPYQSFPKEGVFVEVPRGASGRVIARLLVEKGVVRSSLAFEALCRWRARSKLVAGDYFFDHPGTAFDVFRVLSEGRVYVKSVIVPEGLTMFAIADLMEREGFTTRAAFLKAARDTTPIHDLAPAAGSLEGFLFPATYQFSRHSTATEIVNVMVGRFRETWNSLPEPARNNNARPVDAVVTLASLVARETGVPEERSIRLTILIATPGCRRVRLAIPGKPRCGRRFNRRRWTISFSSPTPGAGTSSASRYRSTTET